MQALSQKVLPVPFGIKKQVVYLFKVTLFVIVNKNQKCFYIAIRSNILFL